MLCADLCIIVSTLTDANGTTVATYSYDTFGTPTIWESFTTGWHNPFLYDGRDGARYDGETGLYWLSARAYDPTLGRFLSRDPLGRAPLFFDASQPYVYGGNNPETNVDPSGQWFQSELFDGGAWMPHSVARPVMERVQTTHHVYHDHQDRYHISVPAGTPRPSDGQVARAESCVSSTEPYRSSRLMDNASTSGLAGCLRTAAYPDSRHFAYPRFTLISVEVKDATR